VCSSDLCEQCGRNRVPEVADLVEFSRWLDQPRTGVKPLCLMLDPEASLSLDALPRPGAAASVELLVGAEGGLTPEETKLALSAGFVAVRLGPRVLRTETAGPAALAAIQCLWGDFGTGAAMPESAEFPSRWEMEDKGRGNEEKLVVVDGSSNE
jgi:16S rRNA (uracil1498-N3)-methyltransferase